MCRAFEEWQEECIQKGIQQGIQTGIIAAFKIMFFFKRGNSQKYHNRFFFIRGRCTELYGKILVK